MGEVATGDGTEVQGNGVGAPAVGSTELPSLRSEGERLKLERDNAQLRAELAQLDRPWWRKGAIVTTLTAIIAAVLPVTTAVQAHYQKERELALQESKQAHEIRTSYLDRLDKPGAKLRTLRFVLATTSDPALKAWARAETEVVQGELNDINKQLNEVNRRLAALPSSAQLQSTSASSRKGITPSPEEQLRPEEIRLLEERKRLLDRTDICDRSN